MKTFASALAAAYARQTTTMAAFLWVLRRDGVIEAFTSADISVVVPTQTMGGYTLNGATYLQASGLGITSLVAQANSAVDNLEITVPPDEESYPQVEILAGRWDNAAFVLFEADYTNPGGGINILKRGTCGEADLTRISNTFEFRGLKQAWQQPLGAVTSKTCRARLGDADCTVDLGPWTHTYTSTAVGGAHSITFAAATEVADYYGEGTITGVDGPNEGFRQKIKAFAAGVVTLSLPMPYAVTPGDSFTLVAGCRKRLMEDCKAKFSNVLNFQGEPDVPGNDILTADPIVTQ